MENQPDNLPGMPGSTNMAVAREAVSVPAILLMVMGGLGAVSSLWGVIKSLRQDNEALRQELLTNPSLQPARAFIEQHLDTIMKMQAISPFTNMLALALSGVMIMGAVKMKNLEGFGLAMAASIVAILPCFGPCCCLGMPVGIWSLVVLNRPEVKSAFR